MSTQEGGGRGATVTGSDIYRWGPIWSRRVGWILDHVWWNTKVSGARNVPATGPAIVAANHTGIIDGPLLHGAIPRGSHFIIKEEFFDSRLGFLMTLAGQIPVDRRGGRAALVIAQELLGEGRTVAIFPEGNRGSGKVDSARAGVAWLAVHSGAPVIPTAILGTRPPGKKLAYVPPPRSKLHAVFGRPIEIDTEAGQGGKKELMGKAITDIRDGLAAHVRRAVEQTGVALPAE